MRFWCLYHTIPVLVIACLMSPSLFLKSPSLLLFSPSLFLVSPSLLLFSSSLFLISPWLLLHYASLFCPFLRCFVYFRAVFTFASQLPRRMLSFGCQLLCFRFQSCRPCCLSCHLPFSCRVFYQKTSRPQSRCLNYVNLDIHGLISVRSVSTHGSDTHHYKSNKVTTLMQIAEQKKDKLLIDRQFYLKKSQT